MKISNDHDKEIKDLSYSGSVWERGSTRVPKKFEFFFFAKI
jgi:hypothetical protein